MYTVYQHFFPNGKRYFGVTRTGLTKRWGYNGYNYKTQLVGRAIEKYGWDNIGHDVIVTCETKEEAEEMERWLIARYNTDDPMKGYNVLPGGDVATNDATPEMRYKLGNGKRGKHLSEEHRKKISEGLKRAIENGTRTVRCGVKASEETKEKMRQSRKAWMEKGNNKEIDAERMRKILNKLWSDEEWREKSLERLSKYRRHGKGNGYPVSDETKRKISESEKGRWLRDNGPTARPVVQLTKSGEFVARYGCVISAAEAVAPNTWESVRHAIGKCCRHQKNFNTCHGFVWMYEDEYNTK